jgi:signal transduction histidine kinase
LQLINDLLDVSAIEAGKQRLHMERVNVLAVIDECIKITDIRAAEKEIEYVCNAPHDLPAIEADRRALKQIVINLLSNAFKFTPKGGKVVLSAMVRVPENAMVIEIRDTGIGIPDEALSTITNPFMRGEPNPYISQEGTGLGLSIVKSLVGLHGGELTIASAVGVGTAVTVTLPLDKV